MKNLSLILLCAALVGCTSNPPLTRALFRAAVTSGEEIALQTHPEATPYIRAAVPVVCAVANSTNANAAAVVDALMATGIGTNRTAILIINGSINLLNVAEASLGGTNQPEIKLYVQDLCAGMEGGLPPPNPTAKLKALRPHLR